MNSLVSFTRNKGIVIVVAVALLMLLSAQHAKGASAKDAPIASAAGGTVALEAEIGGSTSDSSAPRFAGILGSQPSGCGSSSIVSNFDATPIAGGNFLWFNSVVSPSGFGPSGGTLFFDTSSVVISPKNAPSTTVAIPKAKIVFDPFAAVASTSFDVAGNRWVTIVPAGVNAGNIFLSGFALPIPAGNQFSAANPVTWSGRFLTDTAGISVQWQWSAAVYQGFPLTSVIPPVVDENALMVKAVDNPGLSGSSEHAGTPMSVRNNLVGGARGGKGSNFTGSYSGTGSADACLQNADLSVANRLPQRQKFVQPGSQLSYSITVVNNNNPLFKGLSTASGVTVTFQLAAGMSISGNPCTNGINCSYDALHNVVTANLPDIAVGGSVNFMITVKAPSAGGMYTTTATVSSSTPDPDLSNNSSSESTTVSLFAPF